MQSLWLDPGSLPVAEPLTSSAPSLVYLLDGRRWEDCLRLMPLILLTLPGKCPSSPEALRGFRFYLEIISASSPLPSRPALGMGKPRPPAHNRLAFLPSFLPPKHEGVGFILPLPFWDRSSPCCIFFPQEVTVTPPPHLGCCQVLGEKERSKGRGTFLLILISRDIVSITLQIVISTLKETNTQNNTGDRL